MACTAQSLIATAVANGYDKLSSRDLREAIVAAACSGGGVSASFGSGDYLGGQPTFTPSGAFGAAKDVITGRLWIYTSTDGWN